MKKLCGLTILCILSIPVISGKWQEYIFNDGSDEDWGSDIELYGNNLGDEFEWNKYPYGLEKLNSGTLNNQINHSNFFSNSTDFRKKLEENNSHIVKWNIGNYTLQLMAKMPLNRFYGK